MLVLQYMLKRYYNRLQWIANQIDDETNFPNDDGIDEYEVLRRLHTPAFAALYVLKSFVVYLEFMVSYIRVSLV